MFTNQVPHFISVIFLIAILFPIFMIANLVRKNHKKVFYYVIGFYFLYLFIVALATFKGLFNVVALPPRIIVLTTLPLLLFYLLIISNTAVYKNVLQKTDLSTLIGIHIFRLIGSFFIILFLYKLLPRPFAFIAGFGDLITALSSIFVAKAISNKKSYAKKLTLFWNTFGLVDILLTSATAIIFTKLSIETGSLGVDILTQFPFCFIPAFAPATIIFLHISIYRKILAKKFQ